jgi:regulator of cell morphogenesis and NO signaling
MTTDIIDASMTVNAVLAQHPTTGAVFNEYGIDMCCGGDLPLDEAATREGVELSVLLDALAKAAGIATATR